MVLEIHLKRIVPAFSSRVIGKKQILMMNFKNTEVLVELRPTCGEIFMLSQGGKGKNCTHRTRVGVVEQLYFVKLGRGQTK